MSNCSLCQGTGFFCSFLDDCYFYSDNCFNTCEWFDAIKCKRCETIRVIDDVVKGASKSIEQIKNNFRTIHNEINHLMDLLNQKAGIE